MAIKKTMVDALAFVTEKGNMSQENLEIFTREFCEAKTRGASTGEPREQVKLYDSEGKVIGRKCSVLGVWLPASEFNGDVAKMSISREANKLKTFYARTADAVVREADKLRVEAGTVEDAMEKLALFEQFDAELERAKKIRSSEITPDMVEESIAAKNAEEDAELQEWAYSETAEELADLLGVEVLLEAPKEADPVEEEV